MAAPFPAVVEPPDKVTEDSVKRVPSNEKRRVALPPLSTAPVEPRMSTATPEMVISDGNSMSCAISTVALFAMAALSNISFSQNSEIPLIQEVRRISLAGTRWLIRLGLGRKRKR